MTKPCRFCGFIHPLGAPHGPEVDWASDSKAPTRATKAEPVKPLRKLTRAEMEDAEMRAIGLQPAPRPKAPPAPEPRLVEAVIAAGGGEPETPAARAVAKALQNTPPQRKSKGGARHKKVSEAEANAEWVRGIRAKTGLTQEAFAAKYEFNIRTLMSWEQGRAEPGCSATRKLVEIDGG